MPKRTILTTILVLAATGAGAAGGPSPRRDGYVIVGGDVQSSYLHVSENGYGGRSAHAVTGSGLFGIGWHVGPRLDVFVSGVGFNQDPVYMAPFFGATWYPRGWRFAGGDILLEGRLIGPDFHGRILRSGCRDWEDQFALGLGLGCGWQCALWSTDGGAARASLRLGASINGVGADLRSLGDAGAHARVYGTVADFSAAVLLSFVKDDLGPWEAEPDDHGGVPFVGCGVGWGRHAGTVYGLGDDRVDIDGNGSQASIRFGYRRATWFAGLEKSAWAADRGWSDPELSAWRFVAGWQPFRSPVELLGGIGSMDERVAVDMGDCEPTIPAGYYAWSLGAGWRLAGGRHWSLDLRAEYLRGGGRYEIDEFDDSFGEHPDAGKQLRSSRSELVTVGVTLDWNLLPLRRD